MSKYLIAYEHLSSTRTVEAVDTCITSMAIDVAHVLDAVWIIESDYDVEEIASHLAEDDPDNADRFVVISVTAPWGGVRLQNNNDARRLLGRSTFTK